MPSEKERGALRDMLRHIDLAEQFANGHSYESLRDNLQALYAVIRSLEIISEASRRLSDELKSRHVGIPWREMAAAGNFYRHNYEDVTPRRVWKTLLGSTTATGLSRSRAEARITASTQINPAGSSRTSRPA